MDCLSGLNEEQATTYLARDNYLYQEKIIDIGKILEIQEYLNIPNLYTDMYILYLGDITGYIVDFTKGCTVSAIQLDYNTVVQILMLLSR